MGIYQAQRNVKKIFVVLLSIALFCGSALVVCAAENGVTAGYNKIYEILWDGTDEISEVKMENTLIEYDKECLLKGDLTVEYLDETLLMNSSLINIDSTVASCVEMKSSSYKLNRGNFVRVSIGIDSDNKSVNVGLIKLDGTVKYVSGSGNLYHTFEIYEDGTYSFFIQNTNDSDVEIVGYYKIL